jgi:hypothetical protein
LSPTEANEKNGVESSAAYHGFQPLPSQVCNDDKKCSCGADKTDIENIVAEVTRRVLEKYNK